MNNRWSIRAKITGMLLVPLAALVALWVFALSITLGAALELRSTGVIRDREHAPGEAMIAQLQAERNLTQTYLATARSNAAAVVEQRKHTDTAVAQFRALTASSQLQAVASPVTKRLLHDVYVKLDGLTGARDTIDQAGTDRAGAMQAYSDIIDVTFDVFFSMTNHRDSDVAREAYSVVSVGLSQELLSQEDALVTGVATAGRFSGNDLASLLQIIGSIRFEFPDAVAGLPVAFQNRYAALEAGDAYTRVHQFEDKIISDGRTGAALPFDLAGWRDAFTELSSQISSFEDQAEQQNVDHSNSASNQILWQLGIAGVLGLLVVGVSVTVSVRTGRSLIRRLTGLRTAAHELADERLPAVVARLRRGEEVDVAAEVPPLALGSDEIGQVGDAFNNVRRTAIASAVEEAGLRQGINEVFLNIARRSQTLLHRQLNLLDQMERAASAPEDLENLFRVDHLATRMRRHAEDLVILAGAAPGRGWRNPVPLVDVVRGAVSEVEDYTRVTIAPMPEAALIGRAVGDVVHLLAELLENATSYSPPHTRVQVSGQLVPNGFAVEIEDRGLGMTPEAIEEANARLAEPPEFDLSNSAQLGLFVVAQLAARNGIRVVLRPSPFGGVTAVVLVPTELVQSAAVPALSGPPVHHNGAHRPALVPSARDARLDPRGGLAAPSSSPSLEPSAGLVAPSLEPDIPAPRVPDDAELGAGVGRRVVPPAGDVPVAGRNDGFDWLNDRLPTTNPVHDTVRFDPVRLDGAPADPGQARRDTPDAGSAPGSRHAREGLPRRVRQANLAPGLRAAGTPKEDTAPPPARTPEQMRALMSSFQAGTKRGRLGGAAEQNPSGHAPTPQEDQ